MVCWGANYHVWWLHLPLEVSESAQPGMLLQLAVGAAPDVTMYVTFFESLCNKGLMLSTGVLWELHARLRGEVGWQLARAPGSCICMDFCGNWNAESNRR